MTPFKVGDVINFHQDWLRGVGTVVSLPRSNEPYTFLGVDVMYAENTRLQLRPMEKRLHRLDRRTPSVTRGWWVNPRNAKLSTPDLTEEEML